MSAAFKVELRRVRMPLAGEFRTSRGSESVREMLLLRWVTDNSEGWAECAADAEPVYFPERLESARLLIAEVLVPLLAKIPTLDAAGAHVAMKRVPGNPLAKAALESAILDAELRAHGMSMKSYLGGSREKIRVGVSVGICESLSDLIRQVEGYVAEGYSRVKLKIAPGWDVEPVRAIRREFGEDLLLQVDANQAYTIADVSTLRRLDTFDLLLLEQPLPAEDLCGHARLAGYLQTPICLDESITSCASAATAIQMGAAQIINIKPARVGGYLEARAIHDLCLAQGIPVWCGGVLETVIGRAANLQLASLPGFTLPSDISATKRYYSKDIGQEFHIESGTISVPHGPGTGAVIDLDYLESVSVEQEWLM
ncbi:o-succinylbenzoate synthase [Paenarthrobacter sp. 2TAF44]|uniref:o-succinylbenzoate synthase n=1 Tax=Paenarthrobacter sp. 2TAF44 TaxID=3233018 RepID=UPI003F9810B1